jgi:hypothetical protein
MLSQCGAPDYSIKETVPLIVKIELCPIEFPNAQGSDTTGDEGSNAVHYIIHLSLSFTFLFLSGGFNKKNLRLHHQLRRFNN